MAAGRNRPGREKGHARNAWGAAFPGRLGAYSTAEKGNCFEGYQKPQGWHWTFWCEAPQKPNEEHGLLSICHTRGIQGSC